MMQTQLDPGFLEDAPDAGCTKEANLAVRPLKKQKRQSSDNHNNTDLLDTLPEAVLSYICASYLSIVEHFSLLPCLSSKYGRLLKRHSAWPSQLILDEKHHDEKTRILRDNGNLVVIPPHALKQLGEVGFETIRGCGPAALPHLANPHTRVLRCHYVDLTDQLAPLHKMVRLNELELAHVRGETDRGLSHLEGLQLTHLSISDNFEATLVLTGVTLKALAGMPLRDLSLVVGDLPGDRNLEEILPADLPLESLQIYVAQRIQAVDSLHCLHRYPLTKLSLNGFGGPGSLEPLSNLHSLEELCLWDSKIHDEDLSALSHLPLRKLELVFCSELNGKGLYELAGLPLEQLSLLQANINDESLYALRSMPLKQVDLTGCRKITGAGIANLSDMPKLTLLHSL